MMNCHSFIHSRIYIAPLQGNYSEVLQTHAQSKRTVIGNDGGGGKDKVQSSGGRLFQRHGAVMDMARLENIR